MRRPKQPSDRHVGRVHRHGEGHRAAAARRAWAELTGREAWAVGSVDHLPTRHPLPVKEEGLALDTVQDELLAPLSATQRQTLVALLGKLIEHHGGTPTS